MANEEIQLPRAAVPPTVKVAVRHSKACKKAHPGFTEDSHGCDCPKMIRIYAGGGSGSNQRISANTRSWAQAEKYAEEVRDSFDPVKQELKSLKAEKEQKQVRIEEAVALYIADMITRLGDNGTVAIARSFFGHIDPETKTVIRNGHLFSWLDTLPTSQRPVYVADITSAHLTAWRASWDFGSDLTKANRWTLVRGFFNFCKGHQWISGDPTQGVKRQRPKKGNRTAIFTDEQYAAILEAVPLYDPKNVPSATRQSWQQRLTTFIELLRWSGMALVDAVWYRPGLVDTDGVLRYRRMKTGELATVPLPEKLVTLLRDVPLERGSVGADQPFRSKGVTLVSDCVTWRRRLTTVFRLAGLTEVRTEVGRMRTPHPHMLRDSFAVWYLRHSTPLHTVAKMLGHSRVTTTERAYLPWVKELEQAHIEAARRAQQAATKTSRGQKVVRMTASARESATIQ